MALRYAAMPSAQVVDGPVIAAAKAGDVAALTRAIDCGATLMELDRVRLCRGLSSVFL